MIPVLRVSARVQRLFAAFCQSVAKELFELWPRAGIDNDALPGCVSVFPALFDEKNEIEDGALLSGGSEALSSAMRAARSFVCGAWCYDCVRLRVVGEGKGSRAGNACVTAWGWAIEKSPRWWAAIASTRAASIDHDHDYDYEQEHEGSDGTAAVAPSAENAETLRC